MPKAIAKLTHAGPPSPPRGARGSGPRSASPVLLAGAASLACACSSAESTEIQSGPEPGVVIDVTPAGTMGHRPDATVIDGTIYLAYAEQQPGPQRFRLLRLDANATSLAEPVDLYSATELPTDIRVSVSGARFWYAFETFDSGPVDPCSQHVLGAATYTTASVGVTADGQEPALTTGCPTTVDFMVDPPPPSELPTHPQAVDDPTPIVHDGDLVVLTRAWSMGTGEHYSGIQHVYRYDEQLVETTRCLLDLSAALDGELLTLSQNTLIDIDGQVYLIGGLSNGPPRPEYTSSIYAIPLADDLCSVTGTKFPLVTGDGYATRVTASHYADGHLTINYVERDLVPDGQNDRSYLATFVVHPSFDLVETIQFQDETAADNHSSFVVLDGRTYVFYQGNPERLLLQVFD